MKNNRNSKVAKGLIATGGVLTLAALREILLSKEDHDKKEREINKIEKEKEKYMKQIGEYEPFDINKGRVTADDSKLVNLLTRALGVAFTNNDVFTRNKSNVRTFPFIISNNSSITSSIEVELRKYYEMMVASQVANLINHTVLSADSIINIKDSDRKSVDKLVDNVLAGRKDINDLGTSFQKGIYENVILNESITRNLEAAYGTFDQFENEYSRIINKFSSNDAEKRRSIRALNELRDAKDQTIYNRKRNIDPIVFTPVLGAIIPDGITDDINTLESIRNGGKAFSFDRLEDEYVYNETLAALGNFYAVRALYIDGNNIYNKYNSYLASLRDYLNRLSTATLLINHRNFNDPSEDLANSDPYFRLLDLNRVDNYKDSSKVIMKLFSQSSTANLKLEMAAALLISTEILPDEFIDYVVKYLGLPMHNGTKRSIKIKYGEGTISNPYKFLGNNYVIGKTSSGNRRSDVLKFYDEMNPQVLKDRERMFRRMTKKELRRKWNFLDFLTLRKNKLVQRRMKPYRKHIAKWIDNEADIDAGRTTWDISFAGAGADRVHRIIEGRLSNRMSDAKNRRERDRELDFLLNTDVSSGERFIPTLDQTSSLIQSFAIGESIDDITYDDSILTEEYIIELATRPLEESMVYNLTTPVRTVTYKEVEKDPIEYVLPNYTRGKALLYGNAEIDSDQFRNRKVGEPIWIKVTFSDKINSMRSDFVDNDYTTMIGIKSEVHRVNEQELNKVLKKPNIASSELNSIFRTQKEQTLGLLSKIANENNMKSANLNGVLIASINEATSNIASKPSEDYINNPKLAENLKRAYNLSSLCLVDSVAEEVHIMEENSTSWSRLPFSEFSSGGSHSDIRLLASIMNRR